MFLLIYVYWFLFQFVYTFFQTAIEFLRHKYLLFGPHLIHITVKCIFVPGFPRSNYWDTKGTLKQERLGISASHYQPDLHYTLLKVWTCVALVFRRVLTGKLCTRVSLQSMVSLGVSFWVHTVQVSLVTLHLVAGPISEETYNDSTQHSTMSINTFR